MSIFVCPHCYRNFMIYDNELNCGIFRHAIYKNNYQQVDPHMSKEKCDQLIANDEVYGCAKPFRIYLENNNYFIEICDYI